MENRMNTGAAVTGRTIDTRDTRFHYRRKLVHTLFFHPRRISGDCPPVAPDFPGLIPHWFTVSILGPSDTLLFSLDVSLLDYELLSPSPHPVRRILPWYGLFARRAFSVAWHLYPPHATPPPPEMWQQRCLEAEPVPDNHPREMTPLINWMLKESLLGHDRLQSLAHLEVNRRIRPSPLVWEHPDGRFFVFTGMFWLSICPETWFLQEYSEILISRAAFYQNIHLNLPLSSLVFISHPATGQEICLRPLLGSTFCPLPSVWDTTESWAAQSLHENR